MRVHRCFAFVDLSGFTALTETAGDEQAVRVLNVFRALVREVCSRRGVRIAKWLGDGAMLVGVESRPVLEAVLEIEFAANQHPEIQLSIRAGITEGLVILHEGDDYIGHAVNIAARLCELADGGTALAEPRVTDQLPPWATAGPSTEIPVRGLDRPLATCPLSLLPLEGYIQPDPICGIPLTRLVSVARAMDAVGRELWFCSPSCFDTWERRPPAVPEEHGSLRRPLIGS